MYLPGDLVLADRGFNIHDSIGLMCAEVKFPASTRGKKQLSKMEVDTSRQLARVWIQVERVTGVVRLKYTTPQSTLPVNFVMYNELESTSAIDKVVLFVVLHAMAANQFHLLTNLCFIKHCQCKTIYGFHEIDMHIVASIVFFFLLFSRQSGQYYYKYALQ